MAGMKGADCMCGFSYRTPHGEADAIAVAQDHVRRIHPKDFPNGLSRAEALKLIKSF